MLRRWYKAWRARQCAKGYHRSVYGVSRTNEHVITVRCKDCDWTDSFETWGE